MIPSKYRLQVENDNLGTTVDVEVKTKGIKRDASTLEPDHSPGWSADLGTTGLGTDSFYATAEQDNSADGFEAVEVEVVLSNFGATPNDGGFVNVFLQGRGDGASDWPDNENGRFVLSFDPNSTGTFRETVVIS